ncbi:alpha/beta fold hydrolase [Sphaerisporangium dianthi]|uniref:Alpha/beta fold hydrolase n=1 Tax=Sphaerisporangium dianthi TaxID=1436120 RepID=A0ABV9CEL4_9ACTN
MRSTTKSRSAAAGAALAAVLTVSPPVHADTASSPAWHSAASSPAWHACPGDGVPQGMRCATIDVPVDWSRPGGMKVTLDLARFPAADPARRLGSVLTVPGGPGQSGVEVFEQFSGSFTGLRERFDVIAYSPRNSEARRDLPPSCSRPALAAVTDPRDGAEYRAQAAVLATAVERCRADDGTGLVEHMDSLSVARDMEAIRVLLGEDTLSLLAWSYGGIPATAYARLYPERVRAMVVDGTLDQPGGPYALDRRGLSTVEAGFTRFVAWCAGDEKCALHGRDVRSVWRRLVEDTRRHPVVHTSPELGTIKLTDMHLKVFGGAAMSFPGGRPGLADAISKAAKGDLSWFGDQALHNAQGWTMPGAMAARCPDALGYQGYSGFVRGRRHAERISADFGGSSSWESLVCSGWRLPIANPPRPLPVKGLPPVLGLGSQSDSASTGDLVRRIPGSVTVRYDGPGHVMYLAGNRCMTGHADRYLAELELPPPGTVCPA